MFGESLMNQDTKMKNLIYILLISFVIQVNGLLWSHPFMMSVWNWNDSSLALMRRGEADVWVICSDEVEGLQNLEMNITDSFNVSHVWSTDRINTTRNTTEYRRYAHFSIPSDDHGARMMCNRVMTCTVGNQSRYLYLQVEFKPYIDSSVLAVQSGPILECPIRAPNYPPFEYNMIWTVLINNEQQVLATGDFMSKTGFFHLVYGIISGSNITCHLLGKKSNLSASFTYVMVPEAKYFDINSACFGSICSLLVVICIKVLEIYVYKIQLAKKKRTYAIGQPAIG